MHFFLIVLGCVFLAQIVLSILGRWGWLAYLRYNYDIHKQKHLGAEPKTIGVKWTGYTIFGTIGLFVVMCVGASNFHGEATPSYALWMVVGSVWSAICLWVVYAIRMAIHLFRWITNPNYGYDDRSAYEVMHSGRR